MRDVHEIRARFNDLYARRLSQRKERFLSRDHKNCDHNVRIQIRGNGRCGFCRNGELRKKLGLKDEQPFVCDKEGTAKKCPFFECRNTPESVENDFESVISSPSRCGNEYPKLAVLLWCLQEEKGDRLSRLKERTVALCQSLWSLTTFRWW